MHNTPQKKIPPYLFPLEKKSPLSLYEYNPETDTPWKELTSSFMTHAVKRPFFLSPPEYQLEPLFHLAVRSCELPTIAGNAYSLPLTLDILQTTQPDMLVSTPYLAKILLEACIAHNHEHTFKIIFLFPESTHSERASIQALAPRATIVTSHYPLPYA